MTLSRRAFVYTALGLCANTALAAPPREALEPLVTGEMAGMRLHRAPVPVPDVALDAPDGPARLADHRGKVVLLNFWATWCGPCREEMPALDALNAALGGPQFAVVTVAVGPHRQAAIDRFFGEQGIATLPRLVDPEMALSGGMDVVGLPVSAILNRKGQEIARMQGAADWDGPDARALIGATLKR